jgi:hypothetical protein
LEARIAPAATIFIGAPDGTAFDTPKDTEYREANPTPQFQTRFFVDTSASTDPISIAVDSNTSANTFFLRLEAGDEVQNFTVAQSYVSLVKVTSGRAIAFFTDLDGDNDYDDGEFTGLALGRDAKVIVSSNINGDIVTNLDERGTSNAGDDTIDMTGLVSNRQGIGQLEVRGGSVFGSVYSGGDIRSLFIANNVETVLAGTAANGAAFDFFTGSTGGKGTLAVTAPTAAKGASISKAIIGSVTDRVEAGGGGIGGVGGSLTSIQITKDNDGFGLLAGDGGGGDAGLGKANGGAGGSVTSVYVSGILDNTVNSGTGIVIRAGDGGDGLNTGVGGAGGRLTDIFVGFELNAGKRIASANLLADNLLLAGGEGGSGKTGGAGGAITTALVRLQTPDTLGDEIALLAGNGGASLAPTGGRAGIGASINSVDVRNQTSTFNTDTLLAAGDGGFTVGQGIGAAGGSVLKSTVLGFDLQVLAGDGSAGKSGGLGGSINTLTIADGSAGARELIARNVLLNAGKGGNASAGNGGGGGSVLNVSALRMDTQEFIINSGLQGNGGLAIGGRGGAGGNVTSLTLIDGDTGFSITGSFNLRAGDGGDGDKGGGAGGILQKTFVTGRNANVTVSAGSGGDATVGGQGGHGGRVFKSDFTVEGAINAVPVFGSVSAGVGGQGLGRSGNGGIGGNIETVNVDADGAVTILAGDGGSGEDASNGGAAGRGGSVISSAGFALFGAGELRAGDAGALGVRAGAGGSILGNSNSSSGAVSGMLAATDVTVVAGNGSNGGAGGDIRGIAYGSTSSTLVPTPSGDILIQAGQGSAEGKVAGRGGNLDRLFGSVSSGLDSTTRLLAGDGGGVADKAAVGGNVSNLEITFGGGPGIVLTIEAGDGGDAANVKTGAKGGNVSSVAVSDLDTGTIFRSVAAGDGGDGRNTGGLGGSIDRISAENLDIGVRGGEVFGYTKMGGLFAGIGGTATVVGGRAGLAGNVTNVNADSIAAIVAGRDAVPQFAERVERIYLNGSQQLVARDRAFAENGDFTLSFLGETTNVIPQNSTPAVVQAELNLLPSIAGAGGVTVSTGPIVSGFPTYTVLWNAAGNQAELTGSEALAPDVVQTVRGEILPFLSVQTLDGSSVLPNVETVAGQRPLQIVETRSGDTPVVAIEETRGDIAAVPPVSEVQLINVGALGTSPLGAFTLTFGGETTVQLAKSATAAQVQTALNNLVTIQAVGNVTVASTTPFEFRITFTTPQDILDLVTANLRIEEQQRLSLGTLGGTGSATFSLSYKAPNTVTQTTVELPVTANAAAIQAALTALPAIGAGNVVVTGGPGGVFFIDFTTIGDKPALVANGFVPEVQTIDLGTQPAGADLQLGFGNNFTTIPAGSSLAAIQAALNGLPSIQATAPGNTGAVTVVAGTLNNIVVTFNTNGNKAPVYAEALRNEQQTLDLGATGAAATGEFFFNVTHNVPVVQGVGGSADTLAILETTQGSNSILGIVTATDGSATVREVQTLDLSSIIRTPSGEFTLSFGANTTGFLPGTSGPAAIQGALNALASINAVGGVTVAPSVNPNTYSVTFNNFGNRAQLIGSAGTREVQNVDLDLLSLDTTGEFVVEFNGAKSAPLPRDATAAQVQTAINAIPGLPIPGAPGLQSVTVTSPSAGIYNVRYNSFGNVARLLGEGGGVTDRETQLLDLRDFIGSANTSFTFDFGSSRTIPLDGTATAASLETALNALPAIRGIRTNNTGAVTVTETAPGSEQFLVTFNIFGDQPSLFGGGTFNGGQTPRLLANATAAQIEAAIDAVSPIDVSVTTLGVNGTFNVDFNENAGQPQLAVTGFIHEVQSFDVLGLGNFNIRFGSDVTGTLAANASAADVQAALNALPSIQALAPGNTGTVAVTATGNTEYRIVFSGDGDINSTAGTQFVDMEVDTIRNGSGLLVEEQRIGYLPKGSFNTITFLSANLVGAISDSNELGANIFKWTETNGTPGFNLGDEPIDGLVMAKTFTQSLVNFTPEARLTAAGFFDNDNFI